MSKNRLKVASYNINGITTRLAVLLRWLDEFEPDIVVMDVRALDPAHPRAVTAQIGAGGRRNVGHTLDHSMVRNLRRCGVLMVIWRLPLRHCGGILNA